MKTSVTHTPEAGDWPDSFAMCMGHIVTAWDGQPRLSSGVVAKVDSGDAAAELIRRANLYGKLLAILKSIASNASECKMHGDEPSQVDGIEWEDIEAARAVIAKAEGGAS